MRYQKSKKKKHSKFYLAIFFFVFLFLILGYKNITNSLFLKKKERINIVFYGENSLYYSLGEDINYFLEFPSDIEMLVPGGYGYYRLGGLGKLVFLEKKPDLFKMTFSAVTSSGVDLYFYPATDKVYYGEKKTSSVVFPSLSQIFFNKTNGNIVDRLFLAFYFANRNPARYKIIDNFPLIKRQEKALFDQEVFFKENLGLFYKKTYRNIKTNVQIIYTKSYKTAAMLSRIIEGEGIRVVDIAQISNYQFPISKNEKCLVVQKSKKPTVVASDLQKFFGCQLKPGETEISDIILVLGKIEKEWEGE